MFIDYIRMNWFKFEKLIRIVGLFMGILKMRKRENEDFEFGKDFIIWLVGLFVLVLWYFS